MYNADCLYVGIRFSHESIDASLPDQFFLALVGVLSVVTMGRPLC